METEGSAKFVIIIFEDDTYRYYRVISPHAPFVMSAIHAIINGGFKIVSLLGA